MRVLLIASSRGPDIGSGSLLQMQQKGWRGQKARTGLFDTHPSLSDRLASARRDAAPGVFHLGGPAALLFKDFAGLSRAATRDFYRGVLGKRVRRATLVPPADLLGGG